MNFDQITTKDNERYLTYLRKCKEIPCELAPTYVWASLGIFPCVRAYEDDLCWQRVIEHGKEFYYPPVGDWDSINWPQVFDKNIKPGDTFDYIPRYLKQLWEKAMPGHFITTTNRNKWDYIYDLNALHIGTESEKRLCKRFNELYSASFESISIQNVDEVLTFALGASEILREKHPNDDFTELDDDDIVLEWLLRHWQETDPLKSLVMRIDGEIASFLMWDVIDDRIIALYNKNNYEYKGVLAAVYREMCRINLILGNKYINYTYDAGIEGLRKAKLERKPIELLEKYCITYH